MLAFDAREGRILFGNREEKGAYRKKEATKRQTRDSIALEFLLTEHLDKNNYPDKRPPQLCMPCKPRETRIYSG